MSKNTMAKRRPTNDPYEIWVHKGWTWYVLKKYQSPEGEAKNPFARWYCLVKSPYTPEGELGDVYVQDIKSCATQVYSIGELV